MQQELVTTFKKSLLKGIGLSLGLGIGLTASYLFAVSVGTLNTCSSGSTVSSSQVNSNFTTLKTAIESLNTENQQRTPVGTILTYAIATAPTGFLICDGSAVSRTTYAELFAVIGTTWGSGDGSTTFNLPDFQAVAPIGAGTSPRFAENETVTFASYLNDQFQDHQVQMIDGQNTGGSASNQSLTYSSEADLTQDLYGSLSPNGNGTLRSGRVTRGKRIVVNFIIKY